jgi:hypothetical protein
MCVLQIEFEFGQSVEKNPAKPSGINEQDEQSKIDKSRKINFIN